MSDNAPAIWAAVAASFAAVSSWLMWLIQRRNLLESVRPELVLTGCERREDRSGETREDVIAFSTIRNVGRGAALNVVMNVDTKKNQFAVVMSTKHIPILASGESLEINAKISLWWKNLKSDNKPFGLLPIDIIIMCWDARGMRHETRYGLAAVEPSRLVGFNDEIVSGVGMLSRTTTTRPVWLLRLGARLRGAGMKVRKLWKGPKETTEGGKRTSG